MKRKIALSLLLAVLPLLAAAQYKVTSVDSAYQPEYEVKYVLDTEDATIIYGTYTARTTCSICFNRKTSVVVDGEKYRIRRSVNLPVYDEAEEMYAHFAEAGEKLNFVAVFDKFPVKDGFDIIENENPDDPDTPFINLYGIHLEQIDLEEFPDFDKFVDRYPSTIFGKYTDNGTNVLYYMRDGIYVSCRCTEVDDGFLEPKYKRFHVEISNDSDHGIRFDFDKTYVVGFRTKNGTREESYFTKYTPDSFEQYLADSDYYEAKNAVGGMSKVGDQLRRESWATSNEWGKLGFRVLSSMANEIAENNIQEYLATHPKVRPGVLKSCSVRTGETISGYMAFKRQKADNFVLHIPMDDYDFMFNWR